MARLLWISRLPFEQLVARKVVLEASFDFWYRKMGVRMYAYKSLIGSRFLTFIRTKYGVSRFRAEALGYAARYNQCCGTYFSLFTSCELLVKPKNPQYPH